MGVLFPKFGSPPPVVFSDMTHSGWYFDGCLRDDFGKLQVEFLRSKNGNTGIPSRFPWIMRVYPHLRGTSLHFFGWPGVPADVIETLSQGRDSKELFGGWCAMGSAMLSPKSIKTSLVTHGNRWLRLGMDSFDAYFTGASWGLVVFLVESMRMLVKLQAIFRVSQYQDAAYHLWSSPHRTIVWLSRHLLVDIWGFHRIVFFFGGISWIPFIYEILVNIG